MRRYLIPLLSLALIGLGVALSFWVLRTSPVVDSSALVGEAVASPASGSPDGIRVLLVTMWAPSTGYLHVRPFLDCIEEQLERRGDPELGTRVELVQRNTYAEATAVLAAEGADIALICTGSTGEHVLRELFHASHRLRYEYGGEYHSALIVRDDDPALTLQDLAGADIAWTDPNSLTGYRALRAHLRSVGSDPDQFFGTITFTYAHDRSVEAVRTGVIRAAAVDEEILAEGEGAGDLRVVWLSEAFPSPPILVSRKTPQLREVLGEIADRNECLVSLGAEGLEPTTWEVYDSVASVLENGH